MRNFKQYYFMQGLINDINLRILELNTMQSLDADRGIYNPEYIPRISELQRLRDEYTRLLEDIEEQEIAR
jgi:hypothetical protein